MAKTLSPSRLFYLDGALGHQLTFHSFSGSLDIFVVIELIQKVYKSFTVHGHLSRCGLGAMAGFCLERSAFNHSKDSNETMGFKCASSASVPDRLLQ